MSQGNRPVHTVRYAAVQVDVWENPGEHGPWHSVSLRRTYKDKVTGEWKKAHSLGRDDLLPAAQALEEAYRWVASQGRSAPAGERPRPSRYPGPDAGEDDAERVPGSPNDIPF
jgi:hypothetical protein